MESGASCGVRREYAAKAPLFYDAARAEEGQMKSSFPLAAILVLLAAACAGPGGRGDDADDRRADAQRDLERECRMAYRERRDDPRCPPEYRPEDQRSRGVIGAPLPPPPDVRPPTRY
jgi:hypothetical protein